MKNSIIYCFVLLAVMITACSQTVSLNCPERDFNGVIEVPSSRVILGDDSMIKWELNDNVSIFPNWNIHHCYSVKSIDETTGTASFTFVNYNLDQSENSTELVANYAVYPYYEDNAFDENAIISKLPSDIEYTGQENAIKHALMVAAAEGKMLDFTNAQGILCLRLNAQQPFLLGKVKSIELVSNSKYLSGVVRTVYNTVDDKPIAEVVSEGNKILTINMSEAYQQKLPASQTNSWAEYYIPMIVDEYPKDDMKIVINWTDSDKTPYQKVIGISVPIKRSEIYVLSHTILGSNFDGGIENVN